MLLTTSFSIITIFSVMTLLLLCFSAARRNERLSDARQIRQPPFLVEDPLSLSLSLALRGKSGQSSKEARRTGICRLFRFACCSNRRTISNERKRISLWIEDRCISFLYFETRKQALAAARLLKISCLGAIFPLLQISTVETLLRATGANLSSAAIRAEV